VNLLEEHSQQGLVKDGNQLEGSRGGSSKQIRMVLECDSPMHPLVCGLNQGQGAGLKFFRLESWSRDVSRVIIKVSMLI